MIKLRRQSKAVYSMNKQEFDNLKGKLKDAIEKYPKSEFYYRDIRPEPQAHEGRFFHEAVEAGMFPDVECIERTGDGDKYRKKEKQF